MTAAQYDQYAATIFDGYKPLNESYAMFEIKNNYYHDTISEFRDGLMSVPLNIPDNQKAAIADKYTNQLKDYYGKIIECQFGVIQD